MWQRLTAWIREAWAKMFSRDDLQHKLDVTPAVSSEMLSALELWSLMYTNASPWLTADVKSLGLASSIAAELARATTIEMRVAVTGSARATWLDGQLQRVVSELRQQLEPGLAKGGLVFKPYVDGDQIAIDFVQADHVLPVSFDSDGHLTACVFVDRVRVDKFDYVRLEHHALTDAGYTIRNRAFRAEGDTLGAEVPLATVPAWADLLPAATITGVDRPLFGYFKPPYANNVDPSSPLGVSCYSRATDLIRQADEQWSRFLWEFESGERALYVDELAFGRDVNGHPVLPTKRLYRTLSQGGQLGDEEMFHEWTPTLREENLLRGLNAIYKRIEFQVGLAYGTLSDPQVEAKTATEVRTSQQRSYVTVTDTQKALQTALEGLLYAMDVWVTLYTLAPSGAYQAAYDWDDSVVVDKDQQQAADRSAVTMGIMPKWMFLVRNYRLDEATAKQWIADVQAEQPQDFFGSEAGA